MNKSLAETVNFGEAVQKQAYNKAAGQVDTFVQSETAEQKLARSGKMQTAKAIEALAQIGGSVLDYKAKKAIENTETMRENLGMYVSQAMVEMEDNSIEDWTKTQIAKNMPVALHMEMANGIATRNFNAAKSEYLTSIAQNPELQKPDQHDAFVADTFKNEFNKDDPLGLIQGSKYQNLLTSFLQDNSPAVAKYQRAERVERLTETAGLKIDGLINLETDRSYYTGMDGKLIPERADLWNSISTVNALTGQRELDKAKYANVVVRSFYRKEEEYQKVSGLKGKQWKELVQNRFMAFAETQKMPQILQVLGDDYKSVEMNTKIDTVTNAMEAEDDAKTYKANKEYENYLRNNGYEATNEAYKLFQESETGLVDTDRASIQAHVASMGYTEEGGFTSKQIQEKEQALLDAANARNTITRQSSVGSDSVANSLGIADNIKRAIITNQPIRDLKGNVVYGADDKPLMPTKKNVRYFLQNNPNILQGQLEGLLKESDSWHSTQFIYKSKAYTERVKDIDGMMDPTTYSPYTVRDVGIRRDLMRKFAQHYYNEWVIAQTNADEGVDIRQNTQIQQEIDQKAFAKWTQEPYFLNKNDTLPEVETELPAMPADKEHRWLQLYNSLDEDGKKELIRETAVRKKYKIPAFD